MPKNYYLILGISEAASTREVHDAFRRLSKRYHPDRPDGGDRERFIEIADAHRILADPEQRRAYDASIARVRHAKPPRPDVEPLIPSRRPRAATAEPLQAARSTELAPLADPTTVGFLLNDWLDREWNRSYGGPLSAGAGRYEGEVTLGAADARRGGVISLRIPTERICAACGGAGGVGSYACSRCFGAGAIEREIPLSVQFPGGIRDGETYEMPLGPYGIPDKVLSIRFRVVDRLQ